MLTPRPSMAANPSQASGHDSAFGPLRRFYYRNERRLLVAWFMFLVLLNSLPFVWHGLDTNYQLEARIIDERATRWTRPLAAAAKLARRGETQRATVEYERILATMPELRIPDRSGREWLEALTTLSTLHLQQGDAKRARALAAEVVASDPLDYRGHTAYADASMKLGKLAPAISHYQQSLDMYPVQLEVVKELMSMDLEKTRFTSVIDRVDRYLNAVYVSKAAIYWSADFADLEGSRDVLHFPVILDGQPHTYRVYTNSDRTPRTDRFASQPRIEGLRIVPALVDHVVARIEYVRINGPTDSESNASLVFTSDELDTWRTLGHLDVYGSGLMHSPRMLASLAGKVSIPEPKRVNFIEVRLTLQRPVDAQFLDMMQVAYRNSLRADEGERLASRLYAYDQLARQTQVPKDQELASLEAKERP